ncbi:MAG TPA: hypothetical protein VKP58_13165 [Candidatus Acidoferrum sp.]|nr:hypothetical protein [Candidatus Acidoferrum sp.]
MRFTFLWATLLACTLSRVNVFACSCAPPLPEFKTPRQLAELAAGHADAIFEGTVTRAELKSGLIEAHVGDLVPSNMEHGHPHILNGSFTIPSVLPGKYWAFGAVEPDSALLWQKRKVEVHVNQNIVDLALSLIAQ